MEYLATDQWKRAFDKSWVMGKNLEQVLWRIRSSSGRLRAPHLP